MRRRAFRIVLAVLGMCALAGDRPAHAQAAGRTWEITYFTVEGRVHDADRFRATVDGKIFNLGQRQLGTFVEEGTKVTMMVAPPRLPQYAGIYEPVRREDGPPTWEGIFRTKDHVQRKVRLHLVRE